VSERKRQKGVPSERIGGIKPASERASEGERLMTGRRPDCIGETSGKYVKLRKMGMEIGTSSRDERGTDIIIRALFSSLERLTWRTVLLDGAGQAAGERGRTATKSA